MGMSALIAALPQLLDVIRIAGAAYLIWIGIKAWRDHSAPIDVAEGGEARGNASASALFRGGFLISIANPKALLFAAAFFPQFINPAAPKAAQFSILLATFAVIETAWYFTYATGGRTLARFLQRPTWHRLFNRATGGLFVFFGASLLAWRR
jgi:threonine/homoserine/homoserine lactone efflux protein